MTEEMSLFMTYATAFEEAYAANNWGIVDSCFDEEITWAVAGRSSRLNYQGQGRHNTVEVLKVSVAHVDRRFDKRVPEITKGPIAIPGGVYFEFVVTYSKEGLPSLELHGAEWDVFRDGKIAMHYEVIRNGVEVTDYLAENDALLAPST